MVAAVGTLLVRFEPNADSRSSRVFATLSAMARKLAVEIVAMDYWAAWSPACSCDIEEETTASSALRLESSVGGTGASAIAFAARPPGRRRIWSSGLIQQTG